MTAATADRNPIRLEGDLIEQALAAAVKVFAGTIVMRNASGYLTKGQTALGLIGAGIAQEQIDNSAGAAGDKTIEFRKGIFTVANSAAADAITIADIGKPCYAVDDQTVAKTDGRTLGLPTRSPAGIVADVTLTGVRVLFDEDKLRAALAGLRTFLPLRIATLVGAGVYRALSTVRGKIVQLWSITEGVLTTGDATLTFKVGATAITNGVITITQAASAAGDKDYANPTALNDVVVGDDINATVGGTNATATVANCLIEIERA